jgi:hypothetical protein
MPGIQFHLFRLMMRVLRRVQAEYTKKGGCE